MRGARVARQGPEQEVCRGEDDDDDDKEEEEEERTSAHTLTDV